MGERCYAFFYTPLEKTQYTKPDWTREALHAWITEGGYTLEDADVYDTGGPSALRWYVDEQANYGGTEEIKEVVALGVPLIGGHAACSGVYDGFLYAGHGGRYAETPTDDELNSVYVHRTDALEYAVLTHRVACECMPAAVPHWIEDSAQYAALPVSDVLTRLRELAVDFPKCSSGHYTLNMWHQASAAAQAHTSFARLLFGARRRREVLDYGTDVLARAGNLELATQVLAAGMMYRSGMLPDWLVELADV